jgi:hypothetical protein
MIDAMPILVATDLVNVKRLAVDEANATPKSMPPSLDRLMSPN